MEKTDITGLVEGATTSPSVAVENLNTAHENQLNPDDVSGQSKSLTKVQAAPKEATPVVAETMTESRQVASAVSPDVPKLSSAESFGRAVRLTNEQSDIRRRRVELAWKVRDLELKKKPIPEELSMELDILRMNSENNARELSGLDQDLLSKGATAMISSWRDTVKSAIDHPELVLPATGAGALLGMGGGTAIPLVGNFVGVVGGATTGAITSALAANAWDNIKATRGETYDELSVAQKNNVPLNMSPETKSAIANSVGYISGALEFAGEKFALKHIPGLKRLFTPSNITKEIVRNPKLANALVTFGKAVGAGMAEEGLVENLQENMGIFAEELSQTWNGKETSISDALTNFAAKMGSMKQSVNPQTGEPVVDKEGQPVSEARQYWSRVGEATVVGALAGGGSVAAISPVSSGVARIHDKIANKVKPGVKATDDLDTTTVLPETPEPTTQPSDSKIITENGVPKYLSPQQSLSLALVLQNTTEIVNNESVIGKSPIDAVEIQRKMLAESGVRQVWFSGADIQKWADTQEKQLKAREWFGNVDFDLDARVAVDVDVALEMIRQDPKFTQMARPTAEGMSFSDVLAYYKDRPDRLNRDLVAKGLPEAVTEQAPVEATGQPVNINTEQQPITAHLGPSSTDEDILSTLGTKQEANAYLQRLSDEEINLTNSNKVDIETEKINRKIDDLKSLKTKEDLIDYVKNLGDQGRSFVEIYNNTLDDIEKLKSGKPFSELTTVKGRIESLDDVLDFDRYMSEEDKSSRQDPNFKISSGTTPLNIAEIRSALIETLQKNADEDLNQFENFRDEAFKGLTVGLKLKTSVAENLKNQKLQQIQAMRERVTALAEQLPDQAPDLNAENDVTFDEEVELALKEYMTRPLHTDLIRAGVPPKVVKELEAEYAKIREEIVAGTREAAYQEMTKIATMSDEIQKTEEAIDLVEQSLNDPNIGIVELFKENRKELAINPDLLTPEQRSKYIDSVVLKKRKVFDKKGTHTPDTLAEVLGVEDGDTMLEILENVPDLDQAFKNAEALTKQDVSPETLDSVDPNNAAIIKAITNKQKMNMKEFNALIESSWAKARRGIEGTVFAKPDLDVIRQEMTAKVHSIPLNKLNPNAYRMSSIRAGIAKVKAALRGDFIEASRQREIELRADEAYKQSLIVIGKGNKFIKKIARWMRDPQTQQTLKDAKMLDGFNEFSTIINLDPDKGSVKRNAFDKLVKRFQKDQTIDLSIPKELVDSFDPRATPDMLSFEQLSYIYNKQSQLVKLAKQDGILRGEQQEMYINEAAREVVEEISGHPESDEKKLNKGNQREFSAMRKLQAMVASVGLYMPNINYITMRLSQGKENSFIRKFFYDQLKGIGAYDNGYGEKATNTERAKMNNHLNRLLDKVEGRRSRIESYGKEIITPRLWEKSINLLDAGRMTKLQLMTMVAYYGSKTGRQRLSNFNIDPDSVIEVAEMFLTEDDFHYIQDIWDSFDLLKPRVQRMLEEMNAEDITWVQGESFTAFGKTFRGGYIPLRYRRDVNVDQMIREDEQRIQEFLGLSDSAPINIESSKSMTNQGYRESRVENFDGVLNLDFNNVITIGMENIITDVTMFPAIKNVMDLLKNEQVATEFTKVLGIDGFKEFKNHILGSARSIYAERAQINSELADNWKQSVKNFSQRFVKSTLIGVPGTMVMQLSSGAYAWHSQGLGSTPEYIWTVAKLMARPHKIPEMVRLAAQYDSSIGTYIDSVDEHTTGAISEALPKDLFVGGASIPGQIGGSIVRGIGRIEQIQTSVFLNGLLGSVDVALKVPAAITIHNRFLKGKVKGFGIDVLAKMSPEQIENEARAYTTRTLQATLTATSNIEKSKAQKDLWIKDWARWFNDVRNIYNYTMFNTVTKTRWEMKKARKQFREGDVVGSGLTLFGAAQGVIAMQVYTTIAASLINAARGKDDEGEDLAPFLTLKWEKQMKKTIVNNFLNPLLMPKTVINALPIFKDVAFNLEMREDTGNRFVTVIADANTAAINNVAAGLHALKMAFVYDGELTDKELKELEKGIGTVLPYPYRAIQKFREAESPLEWSDSVARDPGYIVTGAAGLVGLAAWGIKELTKTGNSQANIEVLQHIADQLDFKGNSKIQGLIKGTHIPLSEYEVNVLIYTESNGDPNAKSATSTAFGKYQFLESKWNEMVAKYGHLGLTKKGLKTSEEQQDLAFKLLTRDNANGLISAGIEVNLETIYAAHHFGLNGAKSILKLDDGSDLPKSVITDKVRKANPWLKNVETVGEFKKGLAKLLATGEAKYEEAMNLNLD